MNNNKIIKVAIYSCCFLKKKTGQAFATKSVLKGCKEKGLLQAWETVSAQFLQSG